MIGIDRSGYRREFEQFRPLLLRCREPKELSTLDKCFWRYGYAWNKLSHYDDDATISHNNENRNSLRASSPFKGSAREVTRKWHAKGDAGARFFLEFINFYLKFSLYRVHRK